MTDPAEIAIEHIFYARDAGYSPADVLRSVGSIVPAFRPAEWADVDMVLQIMVRRMSERLAMVEDGQGELFGGNVVRMRGRG